jgi:CBS domain-containing protein
MATVNDALARKGSRLVTIGRDASALEAAQLMNQHRIGCLVVLDDGRVSGVLSERDVLSRIVAEGRDPAQTRVHEVMTREVVCCERNTDLEEARSVFKNRRIRHLPVVDESQKLVGLVSIGDLNAYHADVQERTIHLMHEYIYNTR